MSKRIKYNCIDCGWSGSIVADWADIKPRKCPGSKCKTNFRKNPEKLKIELPKNEPTRTTNAGQEAKKSTKGTFSERSSVGEERKT